MNNGVGLLEMFAIWVCLALLLWCAFHNAGEIEAIREALTAGTAVEQGEGE